jgi:hypothetical protein
LSEAHAQILAEIRRILRELKPVYVELRETDPSRILLGRRHLPKRTLDFFLHIERMLELAHELLELLHLLPQASDEKDPYTDGS